MDYKDTYDYFYQKTLLIATTKMKISLLNGIENSKTFNNIQNNIIFEIEVRTRDNSNINKYTVLTNLLHFYQKKLSEYESDRIELSLKNDVVFEYNKINKKDLPNNYTFIKFIADLGVYKAMNEVNRVFRNHASLFIMMYELEDLSEFDLKENEDNISLEDTPLFIKLRRRLYPKNELILEKPRAMRNTKKLIQEYELDEQLLILNLCLVDKNEIPLTEKLKLLILIGEIKDKTIFNESSSNSLIYSKVNKGVLRKGSPTSMINLIENTLIKIDGFELNITKQTLRKHKTTLISEQNQSK